MRSLSQKTFSAAVRRLLADRRSAPSQASRVQPEAKADRRPGPSPMALRRELESFRQAQAAAYRHLDRYAD